MGATTGNRELPRVGRYELLGCLATGGMAEIFLARLRGPSGFERPVVIKRILPHLAKQRVFVDMFLDEARTVAQIRHPNVVQVHELGSDNGELFLVMEFLEGESLGALVRRFTLAKHRLPPRLAAHIVAEACAGLHAAHEITDDQGASLSLVHRDVTPQNVFISYSGQVKILDFGIAKAADRVARTEAGQVKGKFSYMSPEQCRAEALDRRSDVFALGIILHELTTGRRLFQRKNNLLVFKAICEAATPRPSDVTPGSPPLLEAICMKALARARGDRYATAADMRKDLLAAIRELPGTDEPQDALVACMATTFKERISEKLDLLRRVKSGVAITHVPVADEHADSETLSAPIDEPASTLPASAVEDGAADAPVTRMDSLVDVQEAQPDVTPRRRRWPAVAGAAAILTLGGLVGLGYGSRISSGVLSGLRPAGADAPDPPAAPATSPAPPAAAPSASATSAESPEVVVHLETTPPGAHVLVGGKEIGTSPLDLRLSRGATPVPITLRRDGFAPTIEQVTPDVEQRLRVTLAAAARASHPRRPEPTTRPEPPTSTPAPAPTPSSGFGRFD